jgi:hypothetical protein
MHPDTNSILRQIDGLRSPSKVLRGSRQLSPATRAAASAVGRIDDAYGPLPAWNVDPDRVEEKPLGARVGVEAGLGPQLDVERRGGIELDGHHLQAALRAERRQRVLRGSRAGHATDLVVVDPAQLPFLPPEVIRGRACGVVLIGDRASK